MPLSASLTQPVRQGQLSVGNGWRGYFAPFNQALAVANTSTQLGPKIYDLATLGRFASNGVPAPGWFDLGAIKKFEFTAGSKIGNYTSGYRNAVRAKYRGEVGETLKFEFEEMTRTALKIATGTQIFNTLATPSAGSGGASGASGSNATGPLSAAGVPAVAMGAAGYQPTGVAGTATAGLPTLFVPAGQGVNFPQGTYIVCDQDYNSSTFGFTGDAGANVFPGTVNDVDFIRKTSDYVNSVVQVVPNATTGQDALVLTAPFVGGGNNPYGAANTGPTAGAKIQTVTGYASREGGTFIFEWSALFILDTIDGSQFLRYYPRVAPAAAYSMTANTLNGVAQDVLSQYGLTANLEAMAYDDPLDGETVVSYNAYFPRKGNSIQI